MLTSIVIRTAHAGQIGPFQKVALLFQMHQIAGGQLGPNHDIGGELGHICVYLDLALPTGNGNAVIAVAYKVDRAEFVHLDRW